MFLQWIKDKTSHVMLLGKVTRFQYKPMSHIKSTLTLVENYAWKILSQIGFKIFGACLYPWKGILQNLSNNISHDPAFLIFKLLNHKKKTYNRLAIADQAFQKNRNRFGCNSFWHSFLLLLLDHFFKFSFIFDTLI